MSEEFTVQLDGGSPWGFALQGGTDHRSPLRIGRVTTGGRAAKGGLEAGDYILSINGEPTKDLKHLQAQLIVKKTTTTLTLHCSKVKPGVMSPAVIFPVASFAFPTVNIGNRAVPLRDRVGSVQHPKPPLMQYNNGYRRSASLIMPSEASSMVTTSAANSASSPSSCSPMDMEDSMFPGMESSSSGLGQSQTQPSKAAHRESPNCDLDATVQEDFGLIFEQKDSALPKMELYQDKPAEPEQSQNETSSYMAEQSQNNITQDQNENEMTSDVPDQNQNEVSSDVPDQNLNKVTEMVKEEEVEEDEAEKRIGGQDRDLMEDKKIVAEEGVNDRGKLEEEEAEVRGEEGSLDVSEELFKCRTNAGEVCVEGMRSDTGDGVASDGVDGEGSESGVSSRCADAVKDVEDVSGDGVSIDGVSGEGSRSVDGEISSGCADVVKDVEDVGCDSIASNGVGCGASGSVDGEISSRCADVVKDGDSGSGDGERAKISSGHGGVLDGGENIKGKYVRSRRNSSGGSFSKWDLADAITQAAQARSSRDSSIDMSSSNKSEDFSSDHQQQQPQQLSKQPKLQPKQQPLPQKKHFPPSANMGNRSLPPLSQAVIKPSLSKKTLPLLTKEPGWYQQIFRSFNSEVEENSVDAIADSTENGPSISHAYDYRGLKVRRESRSMSEACGPLVAAQGKEQTHTPDSPVNVSGDQGHQGSQSSNVGGGGRGGHIRMESTPAIMEGGKHRQGAKFFSMSSGGTSTEDVLSSSKKTTSYKAQQYSTNYTRKYWSQKDKDHLDFDEKRRKSQEVSFRRTSSSDIVSTSMSASMHRFLQEDNKDQSSEEGASPRGNVLNKIDAAKLHGALSNATMLGKLEQQGVPSQLLPAISQQSRADTEREKEQEANKKKLKPPPGANAVATFPFEGRAEKELSFEKGDVLALIHLVDDNWLEGGLNGKTGIFPKNYVKVLSASEYAAMTTVRPETPKQKAKALFEFRGQTDKELNLDQGDVVTIDRKVDDNWLSGSIDERKGIFPVSYVQLIED